MDIALQFQKIAWILKDESKSILDICNMTGMKEDEVIQTLIYAVKSDLKQCWELEFYNDGININIDINKELIKNEDLEYNMRLLREYLCLETEVTLLNNITNIDEMRFLTKSERWTLFDVLNECV